MLKLHGMKMAVSVALTSATLMGALWLSPTAAMAQSPSTVVRGLPDFTDLVEQVGPSVVNIRTLEKVRPSTPAGSAADDEMQELFRPKQLLHFIVCCRACGGTGPNFFKCADIDHRRPHLLDQIGEVR